VEDNWDTIADWYAAQLNTGSPMHDFARDALLAALPQDMSGARVVDLGCGEGIITRAVAARGATAVGVDPTERLVEHARSIEDAAPCGATYVVDDGTTLATLGDSSAEWVTAGLSLNNVPDLEAGVRSIRRVLAPGGQLAFTIPHPCFETPYASWVDTDAGTSRRIVGNYFAQGFWRSANPSGVRRAGNQHRTLSRYLMALVAERFVIELVAEPQPDQRLIDHQPQRAELPPYLVVRSRRQ
jgi:ubiquinone/menaquinone biosynthesis C-methylase UbiE